MQPWQIQNPKLYEEVKSQIEEKYPTLHLLCEGGVVYLRGNLTIVEPCTMNEIDNIAIEIIFPVDYPKGVPVVRETAGKYPKIADRHFYANGAACLFLPDARFRCYPAGSTIDYFLERLVKMFFVWQIDYDLNNGISSIGGWGHSVKGILEFYFEILAISNPKVVIRFLDYLTSKHIRGYWPCYCNSGKQVRYCHKTVLLEFKSKIRRVDAQKSLGLIKSHLTN